MPDLIVSVSHQLSQDEALRRIQAALAQAKAQFSDKIDELHEGWNGYVCAFQIFAQNQEVSGTVAVNPSDVTVETTLPFLASFFKTTIESRMRDELKRVLV
jgi:Putative polyhydroxyalkanoic acid system protein (PHA_gran_rgn)